MALLPINWEHKIKPGKYEISVSSPLVFIFRGGKNFISVVEYFL